MQWVTLLDSGLGGRGHGHHYLYCCHYLNLFHSSFDKIVIQSKHNSLKLHLKRRLGAVSRSKHGATKAKQNGKWSPTTL